MRKSAWLKHSVHGSHAAAARVCNRLNAGLGAYARHTAWVRYVAATQSFQVLHHRSRVATA